VCNSLSFAAGTSSATLSVSSNQGYPEDTSISIPITISEIGSLKIYSIDLVLTYDKDLIEPTQVITIPSGWILTANTNLPGDVKIALYNTSPLSSAGGELVHVLFNVKSNAQPGEVSALHLSKADLDEVRAGSMVDGAFEVLGVGDENRQPILEAIGNKSIKAGLKLQFRLSASDSDPGDSENLRYYADNLPKRASLNSKTGKFVWKPRKGSQEGIYYIRFYVKDRAGAIDEETISITVE
jgi:hypothetical protein